MQQNHNKIYFFLILIYFFFFFTKIRTVNLWKWTFHSVVPLRDCKNRNRARDLGRLHLHNLIMLSFLTYFPIAAAKVIVVKRYDIFMYYGYTYYTSWPTSITYIRYPKEIMKMLRHFSALQR